VNAFFLEHAGYGADQRIGIPSRKAGEKLHHFEIGNAGTEDLFVLDLTRHDGRRNSLGLENLDEFSKLAQIEPMHRFGVIHNVGRSFFFDSGNDHLDVLASCRFEDKERKFSVPGNQSNSIL